MSNTAKLVSFTDRGDAVEYGGGERGSGYGTPENPHASANCVIPDGTYAIDKRPALNTTEGIKFVFTGPMVNVDLPEGQHDLCPEPPEIMRNSLGGVYGVLLKAQEHKKDLGPLDQVSIKEYVDLWRAVGAKIGQYKNNVIIWED